MDEELIFNARQVGVSLCDMNEEQSDVSVTGIIFKVSVICGCQLPTHDAHVNALDQEFLIFIKEFGYDTLTVEEILTAFRMNANFRLEHKIETYGAVFNIDFASKVLKQYRDKRWALDYKLSKIHHEVETRKILDEEEAKRREKVVAQFKKYIEDENSDLDLSNCYMQLAHDGAFHKGSFSNNFTKEATEIYNQRGETTTLGDALKYFNINPEIAFEAEHLAVRHLFKEMKIRKRLDIYDANWKVIYPGYSIPEPEKVKDDF